MKQDSDRNSDKKFMAGDRTKTKPGWWRRIVIALTVLLLGSSGAGLIYGWYIIQRKLIPLIETEASEYLNRPLKLGDLKGLSLTGARFGSSSLPATPTNPDWVTVEAVKIDLNPLYFLRKRILQIDINLIEPNLYIEQGQDRVWTPTDFGSEEATQGGIKVDVDAIRFKGGELTLAARQAETGKLNPPVTTKLDRAVINLVNDGEEIHFDVAGELIAGGKFTVDGTGVDRTGIIDLDVIAQQLDATSISNLLALPLELQQGDIQGKIGVKLTAAPIPELRGMVNFNDVDLQIPGLVKPFSDSNGKLRFQGSKIALEGINTNFGKVSGLVNGSLDLAGEGDYNINTKTKAIDVNQVIAALELEPLPVPIKGEIVGDVKVRGKLEEPVINFDLATTTASQVDRLNFERINSNLELIGTDLFIRKFTGVPQNGGVISGSGKLELDETQNLVVELEAENINAKAIARSYNNQLPVDLNLISGKARLTSQLSNPNTFRISNGKANFPLGNGMVEVEGLNYAGGKWNTQLQTTNVEFGSLPIGKGSAPTIAKGLVDGLFQVSGTADVADLAQVRAQGAANLDTVGGEIILPQIQLADGRWQANASTSDLKLRQLFPEVPPEFNDNLDAMMRLTGNIPDRTEPRTLIDGVGDLILAEGKVRVEKLNIVEQNWQAEVEGFDLKLKQLSSTTPDQFAGLINGKLTLAGTIDNITPDGIKAQGDVSLSLPEGVFQINNLAIADGNFKTTVIPQNVDLSLFADPNSDDLELNGQLGGELEATGRVDNLSPTAVAAKGNLTFSEGIDLLEQPIGAAINWDGKRLDVLKAKGDGLEASGYVELDPSFFSDIDDKLAAIDRFEFEVDEARWIDINKLRLTLPSWATNLDYYGRGDFMGKISGIPSAMNIDGNLNLRNFRVENIVFKPLLTGTVQVSQQTGVKLQLAENEFADFPASDKIELVLDADFFPLAFAIERGDIAITGRGQGQILEIMTQNVPVDLLKTAAIKAEEIMIPENMAIQPVAGDLSGKFIFNFDTLATAGEDVIIDSPALGSIRGNYLRGDFQYDDNYFAIQNGEFKQRNSLYKIDGKLLQKPDDLEVDGQIRVDSGQIQDILIALQIFELQDFTRMFSDRGYDNANSLYDAPDAREASNSADRSTLFTVGMPDASIIEQLQLLAEIQAWLSSVEQERRQALLPPIKALQGTFDGEIDVSGSYKEGLDSQFEFLGQQWRWGNLAAKNIVAQGNFRNGILTLLPVAIELQDVSRPANRQPLSPKLLFTGTFGGETQSGQLRLVQIPVEVIEQLFSFPPEIALGGVVNAAASLAGTPENPQARGEITIADASLNQTSIQSTKGSFNYSDARLGFSASSIVAQGAEPLTISGTIPYQLPFASTPPKSDRLELQLNVKNKGLALLDIFSQGEISWLDGEGEIALDISGIFDPTANIPRQLIAKGSAIVNNATIAAKTLPNDYLTNVNGEIFFDLDTIRVDSFQGDFGGGKISAAGTLPLDENISPSEPLTINFNDIAVDLKGLYDGGVKGNLTILGTAVEPDITGDLTLFDGTVLLADTTTTEEDASFSNYSDRGLAAVTEYKNLQLEFGEDIQISQLPIFTFFATGALNLNGTFDEPNPEGTIVLQRGQVNLFTTQLNLSRDYENTARFSRNNGLDPFLDVSLVGSALETTDSRVPSDSSSTEIKDIPASSYGSLETVRISAKVKGLASQITNKIQLTSSPPRSQTEILALLGGSFVNTLGRGASTLGLANLAGSALFGSLNSEFNNAFPIGELRLFPTQIIEDEERTDRRIDGLAGEIAVEIVDNFSFSTLKILNIDIPAQFGFRYRLNDNFVLRGTTNFEDVTRGTIEFESRF